MSQLLFDHVAESPFQNTVHHLGRHTAKWILWHVFTVGDRLSTSGALCSHVLVSEEVYALINRLPDHLTQDGVHDLVTSGGQNNNFVDVYIGAVKETLGLICIHFE